MLTVVCHINHLHFPVLNGQYEAGWNTNQNQMKNTSYFYIYILQESIYGSN